jgi:acyl-homoserine-lactone acylase
MKRFALLALAAVASACASPAGSTAPAAERDAWREQAQRVTITRDDWGIPHVHGRSDADTAFGVMYAQAEDDFNRVETNYINAMGRLAEAEGEQEIYRDLRMKLYMDPADIKAKYGTSPPWLQALMTGSANGLNYYLATHPDVKPRVITRFEPWMALMFTEGSIGGDIERISLADLEAFYGEQRSTPTARAAAIPTPLSTPWNEPVEPTGSNGIAIAPSNAVNRHALLLINPHTSFYFRSEAQMTSDEGLNAYGASTWGQFFVYQGFNERAGWMHTSSGVDNIDEYLETITKKGDTYYYRYGTEERPVQVSTIVVPYRGARGGASKTFTVYRTHHGPVVREANGKWIAVRLMQDPVQALMQSYSRMQATNYGTFRDSMELHTNSSNNTVFADAEGNIAYFHSNFIPRRSPRYDWTKPVDGSDPASEWNGLLSIDETPGLRNPPGGWLYNSNNWPWSAAGPFSPKRASFPAYVERSVEETPRGSHALRVLDDRRDFTLDSLLAAAYDSYLPAFASQIPLVIRAWDQAPASNPLKKRLAEQIDVLRTWDFRWSTSSAPTSLAVYWGDEIGRRVADAARTAGLSVDTFVTTKATPDVLLQALASASDKLTADFGSWKTPWGDINRFQRLTGEITATFDDSKPSIPVGFTSARWGSLASFGARTFNTKKMYGTTGNSFVAVVEFGDRVTAKAVTAGGQSGDPRSKHFSDQALRYSKGDLRDVYFYPAQLQGHVERTYHPGQ